VSPVVEREIQEQSVNCDCTVAGSGVFLLLIRRMKGMRERKKRDGRRKEKEDHGDSPTVSVAFWQQDYLGLGSDEISLHSLDLGVEK
jgi:hypothetical protein